MGIVIINGKRYDSVTGLMLNDQTNSDATETNTVKATSDNQTPDWIASYVDEVGHQTASPANQANAATDTATSSNTNAVPVADDHSHDVTVSMARQTGRSARRSVATSNTLNRRFVRRPLAENGKYAESLAEHQLKLAHQAKQAVAPIDIPEEAQLDAAAEANRDFIPILTRRQAEGLSKLAGQAPLSERVAEAERRRAAEKERASTAQPITVNQAPSTRAQHSHAKQQANNSTSSQVRPAIRLTAQQQPDNYDDDVLNERLSQLSQILQNAQELDEQDNRQARRSRKAEQSPKQTKQHQKREKRARRKFRAPAIFATAGAMAAIAGIGVYIAMPSISVKMAANKAGIDAKNPYTPAGYTIDGEVAYQSGRVTINYRSKSGADGYSVTQEANSTDTDDSLQQQISSKNNGNYQTMQTGEKTVYRYRDMVTWLDNGIQYTINTNDYLDSQQISDIANSL